MKKTVLCMILLLVWCGPSFGFTGSGSGTEVDPYIVNSASLLNEVRDDLTAHYKQTADILNLSSTYANWIPIAGGGSTDSFVGSYNGQAYKITNLSIDRPSTLNVGLFGLLGNGAIIRNVRLEGVSVKGRRGVGSLIGRVTGDTTTLIERCYAVRGDGTDTVGSTVVGYDGATGGLVGSHNSVTETPGGTNNPVISQCFADLDVSWPVEVSPGVPNTGRKDKYGGLAGCTQKGTIMDSYARGSVTVNDAAAERVGGLAGCAVLRGEILRSYSTGLVTSTGAFVGGLLGRISVPGQGNNGVVTDSYWDTETSGQSTSAGGFPRNTAQMKTQANFVGWDFNAIWAIDPAINDGYPYLLWEELEPEEEDDPDPVPQKRRAMRLEGIIDRVEVPHSDTLDVNNNSALTVEAWVKKSSAQTDDIAVVVKDKAYALFLENGNEPAFRVWENNTTAHTTSSEFPLIANRWYHLTGTFDGTNIRIYINGYLHDTEILGVITLHDDEYPIGIGANLDPNDITNTGWFFHGVIDEVRIWKEVRSAVNIRTTMCRKLDSNLPNNDDFTDLMGYWRFDEISGQTLQDDSGNENTATIFSGRHVCSSAPIGDESGYDYTGSSASDFEVTLLNSSLTGESFKAVANGGTWSVADKSGLQVYYVEDVEDDDGRGPLGWKLLRERGHFGVFVTGGSDPTYNLTYTYNPAGIGRYENLKLAFRNGNCEPWKDLDATIDVGVGVLTKQGQSGTEYILGTEMDPRNAIEFDGAGYVNVIDVLVDNPLRLLTAGTLEAWIYLPETPVANAGIIHKVGNSPNNGYSLRTDVNGTGIVLDLYNSNNTPSTVTSSALTTGTWYHIAATWDTGDRRLYINGVLNASAGAGGQSASTTADINLTIGTNGTNFRGIIDEVRIWEIARGVDDIRDTMCRKLDPTRDDFTDLVGYWRFDEETDSAACPDYSDYSNTGTMTGFSNIREARICSSAPIGDDSAYSYQVGTILPDIDPPLAHPDGDAFQANATTEGGIWSEDNGIHVYLLREAPVYLPDLWVVPGEDPEEDPPIYSYVSPNGLTPPSGWSSVDYYRYWGAFVTYQPATPLQYQVIYYYDGNPMVPADDSVVGLAKRNNYCDRNWIAADESPDTVNKTLTKTGETGTEYILGGRDTPLAITLASFTATVTRDGCVEIEWETATEIDTLGFYLWRSTEEYGEYEMISNSYTRSRSVMETMGASYAFTDCGVDFTSGDRYYYKLEEIEIGPKEARHFYGPMGPVSETVGASRPVRDTAPAPTASGSGVSSCFIGASLD
jgi:hypothetical protein